MATLAQNIAAIEECDAALLVCVWKHAPNFHWQGGSCRLIVVAIMAAPQRCPVPLQISRKYAKSELWLVGQGMMFRGSCEG